MGFNEVNIFRAGVKMCKYGSSEEPSIFCDFKNHHYDFPPSFASTSLCLDITTVSVEH